MEARRFGGLGASMPRPAYKFDPTDTEIVAHYLLPRAAGLPNPHAHAVIVDTDPCSCPPWELLSRHGHAGSDHAFFFGPVPKTTKTGRRVAKRAVSEGEEGGVGGGGGTWALQRSTEESLVLLRGGGEGGGAEIEVRYMKRYLAHRGNENARTTGWVMDEYEIIDPPLHGAVLSRVRMTAMGKKKRQEQQAAAAAANYLDDDGPVAANHVVMGKGEATSGGAQAEAVHQGDGSGGFLGEMAGYHSALPVPSAGDDGGYYSALPMPSAGEAAGYDSALSGAGEDGGDNSNSYFSEGITFNYCFNDGEGSGDNFLQDDGGNGD